MNSLNLLHELWPFPTPLSGHPLRVAEEIAYWQGVEHSFLVFVPLAICLLLLCFERWRSAAFVCLVALGIAWASIHANTHKGEQPAIEPDKKKPDDSTHRRLRPWKDAGDGPG